MKGAAEMTSLDLARQVLANGESLDMDVRTEYVFSASRNVRLLAVAVISLTEQLAAKDVRQQELLALVAKISQSTPLDSEVAEALNQRGVMLAEIGTLRSKLRGEGK